MKAIINTNFNFPLQKSLYHGKVRDVYNINDKYLVMVVTDRISAFDVVLPRGIPFKGKVLNQLAVKFLKATEDSYLIGLESTLSSRTSFPFWLIYHEAAPLVLLSELIIGAQ